MSPVPLHLGISIMGFVNYLTKQTSIKDIFSKKGPVKSNILSIKMSVFQTLTSELFFHAHKHKGKLKCLWFSRAIQFFFLVLPIHGRGSESPKVSVTQSAHQALPSLCWVKIMRLRTLLDVVVSKFEDHFDSSGPWIGAGNECGASTPFPLTITFSLT